MGPEEHTGKNERKREQSGWKDETEEGRKEGKAKKGTERMKRRNGQRADERNDKPELYL